MEASLTGDRASILAAADAMTQLNGNTDIAQGLRLAGAQFHERGRELNETARVAIIFTDGMANAGTSPIEEAGRLKFNGTEVFVVGVGSSVNQTELRGMASSPNASHVFLLSDYTKIASTMNTLVRRSCVLCWRALDVMVILDDSTSITDGNFALMQSFTKMVASSLDLATAGGGGADTNSRIGVITFATAAKLVVAPTDDEASVDGAVDGIVRVKGGTAIGAALDLAADEFQKVGRPGAIKVAFLLTDGQNNQGPDPIAAADAARAAGVHVMAVGIGSGVSVDELRAIADPGEGHVLAISDFEQLALIEKRLVRTVCEKHSSWLAQQQVRGRGRLRSDRQMWVESSAGGIA